MSTSIPATTSTDRIEMQAAFAAPRPRVWTAITDVKQFNAWFGVMLTSPFTPGATVTGKLTAAGFEHLTMSIWIEQVEPERLFSFRWHPYAIDEGVDFTAEPTTVVSFTLEDVPGGTRVTLVESGFDALPESRRAKAFAMNERGWAIQLENIRKHLAAEH